MHVEHRTEHEQFQGSFTVVNLEGIQQTQLPRGLNRAMHRALDDIDETATKTAGYIYI